MIYFSPLGIIPANILCVCVGVYIYIYTKMKKGGRENIMSEREQKHYLPWYLAYTLYVHISMCMIYSILE